MESHELTFRRAERGDVDAIVKLLADDALGSQRENYTHPLPASYYDAFESIDRDANNELIVATRDGEVIGTLQLTYLPSLTFQGSWRAQIEAVRVDERFRSQGIGKQLFEWAIERARARGCHILQLTTNKARPDAQRFYEQLGFVASHTGMKMDLRPSQNDAAKKNHV